MVDLHTKTVEVTIDDKVYTLSELATGEVEAFDLAVKRGEAGFGPITRALVAAMRPKHPEVTAEEVLKFPPRVLHALFDEVFKLVRLSPEEADGEPGKLKAV
jgi:hypothetical protein